MEEFQSATLRKVALLHECCSRCLNCTNGTKLRETSHIYTKLKFNNKNARSINLPSFNPFIRKFHKELLAKDNISP